MIPTYPPLSGSGYITMIPLAVTRPADLFKIKNSHAETFSRQAKYPCVLVVSLLVARYYVVTVIKPEKKKIFKFKK